MKDFYAHIICCLIIGLTKTAYCQELNNKLNIDDLNQKTWIVGIEIDPPFVQKDSITGIYTGISVELWKRIATNLKLNYKFVEVTSSLPLKEKYKNTDIVSTLSVRFKNEQSYDCSHAYLNTGLSIALRREENGIPSIINEKTLNFLIVFFCIIIAIGILVWLIERKSMPSEFGGKGIRGVISGLLWAMEGIVGKEHSLSPKPLSRFFYLLWTYSCLFIVTMLTAEFSSELTLQKIEKVNGPDDLSKSRIGFQGGIARDYLSDKFLNAKEFGNIEDALNALCKNEIDAVIYPAPNLRFLAAEKFKDRIDILPNTFANFGFGFGLPLNFVHLKAVNLEILNITKTHEWNVYLHKALNNTAE